MALGPGFIKLGQALSTRADLIGAEVAEDLAMLRDRLPPFPAAEARAVVTRELGAPIADLFQSFDDTPVAAASIAQVHFAVTSDGRAVAVKVLRPGVERAFQRDLLARTLEETDWNVSEAARRLDLARSHVYQLIATFELKRSKR